jgi:hypothetical protein
LSSIALTAKLQISNVILFIVDSLGYDWREIREYSRVAPIIPRDGQHGHGALLQVVCSFHEER